MKHILSSKTPHHIRFYISDYGFGHASRQIALMRALSAKSNITISVRCKTAAGFIRDSCTFVQITEKQNDVGTVMYANTAEVDKEKTRKQFDSWINAWDEWIADETAFCRENKVDLIISDITPQAFLVSHALHIPSVAISNFTWELIFKNLFPESPHIDKLHEAYNSADLCCLLPLCETDVPFREVIETPLLSREITVDKDSLRKRMGISDTDVLVYVGSGLSFNAVPECIPKLLENGFSVLISGSSKLCHPHLYQIPPEDTETQNYMAMCDLIITKPGYSTVAEALSAQVPMIIFRRGGFAEDEFIINPLLENRVAVCLTWDEIANGSWISHIKDFLSMKENYQRINNRFIDNGIETIISQLMME